MGEIFALQKVIKVSYFDKFIKQRRGARILIEKIYPFKDGHRLSLWKTI